MSAAPPPQALWPKNAYVLETRSLADPRLSAFINAAGASRWDLPSLTLAALYVSATLEVGSWPLHRWEECWHASTPIPP